MSVAELKILLHKFIAHKRKLSKVDRWGYYAQPMRSKALNALVDLDRWISKENPPTQNVVRFILSNENNLKEVLPHSANASYKSCDENFNLIITECRKFLNP